MSVHLPFENTYVRLPDRFYARIAPTPTTAPRLIRLNRPLAADLGLVAAMLESSEGVDVLAGNRVPEGADPVALAYAGHQFGQFVPQLGDGRAILLGEVVGRDGVRRDIQLKGAGPTPFSRSGDGRASLGPVMREYLVSEAMNALGVPTTRALAAVVTGERVIREEILPGAVLTRVAKSHVRVGTFQFFAARGDIEGIRLLADHVISRHYPQVRAAAQPYLALLEAVVTAQAALVAHWMSIGFIHGVMNTDNMSIAGETIDYGPCAFMDGFDPEQVYSSIDRGCRYSYGNQPRIAQWNLARLAETLLELIDADGTAAVEQAKVAINGFSTHFEASFIDLMRRKLGLGSARDGDLDLVKSLLGTMAQARSDFTLTFRHLCAAAGGEDAALRGLFTGPAKIDAWLAGWRERLATEGGDDAERAARMRQANPLFIPRNHRVEEAIRAGIANDFGPFERLSAVLARPYDNQPESAAYARPPKPDEVVLSTFCGT
ncbi:YdiU family protein [Pseudoxanthobacter sp. M-2]|uniref:protein adenylyltransferase SelO n=1 Tax=Pseudoxanthobacter sp. M-2 TaxID=3078754 RepID=UPI0038FC3F50